MFVNCVCELAMLVVLNYTHNASEVTNFGHRLHFDGSLEAMIKIAIKPIHKKRTNNLCVPTK